MFVSNNGKLFIYPLNLSKLARPCIFILFYLIVVDAPQDWINLGVSFSKFSTWDVSKKEDWESLPLSFEEKEKESNNNE